MRIPFSSRPKTLDVQPTFEHSLSSVPPRKSVFTRNHRIGAFPKVATTSRTLSFSLLVLPYHMFFLLLCLTACIIKACLDIPFLPYRKCISRNHINLIILGLLPTSMNTWHSAWVAACIGIELCTSSGEQFHIRSLSHNLVKTKCAFSDQIKT